MSSDALATPVDVGLAVTTVAAIKPRPFALRGYGVGRNAGKVRPPTPTAAIPGSPEKIDVMTERARLGFALYHPDDAPMDFESREMGVDGQVGRRHGYGAAVHLPDGVLTRERESILDLGDAGAW